MDINDHLQPIVASLIDSLRANIETDLRARVTEEVVKKIASTELDAIVTKLVEHQVKDRLDKFKFEDISKQQLVRLVAQLTEQLQKDLAETANKNINAVIKSKLDLMDLNAVVNSLVQGKLESLIKLHNFPEASIPNSAINMHGLRISGDNVKGGIIEDFGSVGIEDRATSVQLTIMDHATVFENSLYAPSAEIKGTLTVEGNLIVNGEIPTDSNAFKQIVERSAQSVREKLDNELFQGYSDIIARNLATNGIDLDRITQGGQEVVSGNKLGYHIVDTNIQRLGMVTDLQTKGEALLSDTLYVTNGRVGVNTMDPGSTFVIWDAEVEMIVTKRQQDTGFIGTPRRQTLILGSNNKDNIVLDPDGGVSISNLTINKTRISSGAAIPNYSGTLGEIVFNELPDSGSPIGWVCIGGHRWAKFGRIE